MTFNRMTVYCFWVTLMFCAGLTFSSDNVKIYGETLAPYTDENLRNDPGVKDLSVKQRDDFRMQLLYDQIQNVIVDKTAVELGVAPDAEELSKSKSLATSPESRKSMADLMVKVRLTADMATTYRQRYGQDLSEKNKKTFWEDMKTSAARVNFREEEVYLGLDMYVPQNGWLEKMSKDVQMSVEEALAQSTSGAEKSAKRVAAEKALTGSVIVTPEELERAKPGYEGRPENAIQSLEKWAMEQKQKYLLHKAIMQRIEADAQFSDPEFRKTALQQWGETYATEVGIFDPK